MQIDNWLLFDKADWAALTRISGAATLSEWSQDGLVLNPHW
jgi:hypothetical protein